MRERRRTGRIDARHLAPAGGGTARENTSAKHSTASSSVMPAATAKPTTDFQEYGGSSKPCSSDQGLREGNLTVYEPQYCHH